MQGKTLMAALAATFVLVAPSLGAADECVCLAGAFELRGAVMEQGDAHQGTAAQGNAAQGTAVADGTARTPRAQIPFEQPPFVQPPLESRATEGDDAQSLPLDVLISAIPSDTLRPYEQAPAPLLWCDDGGDPRCQQGESGQFQFRVVSVASFTLTPQPSLAFRPRGHSPDPSFLRRRSDAGPEGFNPGVRRPPRG